MDVGALNDQGKWCVLARQDIWPRIVGKARMARSRREKEEEGRKGKARKARQARQGCDAGSVGSKGTCPRTARRDHMFVDWPKVNMDAGTEVTAKQESGIRSGHRGSSHRNLRHLSMRDFWVACK